MASVKRLLSFSFMWSFKLGNYKEFGKNYSTLTFVAAGSYYDDMKKASVSDLKNQISRYLDYVRHGGTVLVLDRKVPVAELKPVAGKSSNGKLAALERKGILRRGSGSIPAKFFKEKLGGRQSRVLDALLEERNQGR